MTSMFRRMKSPRTVEFRNTTTTAGVGIADGQSEEQHKRKDNNKGLTFSVHHRRHKSDEFNSIIELIETPTSLSQSEEVVDYQLSDPGPYLPPQLPPRHRGGSGGNFAQSYSRPGWRRTRSSGTMSGQQPHLQQQPPPTQEYFVPVDTIRSVQRTPHNHNGISGAPQLHHLHSSKDKRNKEMHKKIVEQNDPSVMFNRRKSRSLENLIDTNDYSLPFDIVPERTTDQHSKSRSPEGQLLPPTGHIQNQTTRSDSNLTMHSTTTPPTKPRRTRDVHPPSFAPPPPPTEDTSNIPVSPTVIRRGDDYEEPWSSRFHLPPKNRKQRSETDLNPPKPTISPSTDTHRSRPQRSHTIHPEMSPEPDVVPGIPPKPSSRNRSETDTTLTLPTSPQLDAHRQRTVTGESRDYCIPPDALHVNNGVSHGQGVAGLGRDHMHGYVNQPPIPLQISSLRNEKKHGYPPLLPSEYYITDIQNLPPPAFPIDTSLPLEDQP